MLCKSRFLLCWIHALIRLQKKETEESMENHWDQVDDFKWLKAEHSPNWSILPEAERLSEEIWTETVPGKPGKNAEDILKEIGVYKKGQ